MQADKPSHLKTTLLDWSNSHQPLSFITKLLRASFRVEEQLPLLLGHGRHSKSPVCFVSFPVFSFTMRLVFLATAFAFVGGIQSAAAQEANSRSATTGNSQDRIALSTRPETNAVRPMRLACAPLAGQVFEANGRPLVGATLLVKGTHQVYVTDSEGKFQLTEPVYEGQVLTIGAAGYNPQDVPLDDCTLPRLVLEKNASAHIKHSGKRAGQVIRLNNQSTDLK
jgi:hypothetical protein